MEVMHNLGVLSLKRNVSDNAGFLLANKKGSYCSFFNEPASRYFGLFCFDEKTMSMHKFIENIEIVDGNNSIYSLKNGFYFAERRRGNATELFLMPKNFSSLVYELDSEKEIDLLLDFKDSYDNRQWGRHYDISEEKGCIAVKFTKKTDKREDSSDGREEFTLHMAIKSDKNIYRKNDNWIERHYYYDEERNSAPFKRHVYNALRLKGAKFVFSMSKNKKDAIEECNHIFGNINKIKNNEKEYFLSILKNDSVKNIISNKNIADEIKVAYINALNSLNNLIVDDKHDYGIFAGLPWFFQFWARDSLVSLKALSKISGALAKKILFDSLNRVKDDGRLATSDGRHISKNLGNADGHGWLSLRCGEMIGKINTNKQIMRSIRKSMILLKKSSSKSARIKEFLKRHSITINKKENEHHTTLYDIECSLEKSLNGLLKFHTKDSFEVNGKLETWMDTEFENDDRRGVRIEMQALRLSMYKLMFDLTLNQKYKALENILKAKVRDKFWSGKILADGLDDFTIRPNIFIAAYAYPELLAKKEWEICLDNALKSLWLDWGGVSTIDKNNRLFTSESTGENIKSYHRGDSWFWINNLTALTLYKINKIKFKRNIQKIINASTEEILWKGCIGCHSELSSAKELSSKGCFNQAWSDAMFVEMIDEFFS